MIKQLAENNSIMLLHQDKGKGLVIVDNEKCTEKYLNLLNPNQCNKLSDDPTKTVENKIKRIWHKIKYKLSKQDYVNLYPTDSTPWKSSRSAKKT